MRTECGPLCWVGVMVVSNPMTPERLFEIRVQRSTARACKTVDAVAVFEAVDELLAEVERLRTNSDGKDVVVGSLARQLAAALAEVTRLRPMEAALAAARELHAAIDNTWPLYPGNAACCAYCCVDGHGGRTSYCRARCDATTACWPCPNRAALDGGA